MPPLVNAPPLQSLYLSWQNAATRRRFIVGTVHRNTPGVTWRLCYDTPELEAACAEGFKGYPAFTQLHSSYVDGVRQSLSTRIPPRQRSDFDAYLRYWCLDPAADPAPFDILGYSGGKLPRDTFRFIPVLDENRLFNLITEIVGTRHHLPMDLPEEGAVVSVRHEPQNAADSEAVVFDFAGQTVGYMIRGLNHQALKWLNRGKQLTARIARRNGTDENPILLAHVYESSTFR